MHECKFCHLTFSKEELTECYGFSGEGCGESELCIYCMNDGLCPNCINEIKHNKDHENEYEGEPYIDMNDAFYDPYTRGL